jgi:exodeoxyribonuclease VII small subunit
MNDADHTPPETFEMALAALGEIVTRLESGSLGLSDSITAYERGVGLLRRLHEELAAVEQRVSLLVRIDEEGHPVMTDLEAAAADFAQSADPPPDAAARGSKRPRGPASRSRAARLPGMDDAGEGA